MTTKFYTSINSLTIQACSKENKFFDDSSYHCDFPRKILFDDIDPSLALGFFIKTYDQFSKFCQHIQSVSCFFCIYIYK